MRKETLEERQRQMRVRHAAKPHRGRPRKKKLSKQYFLRRRIVSRFFVLKGWSAEKIAAHFDADPLAVKRWIKRGMPLVDPVPQKKKQDEEEMRPYFEFS